MDKFEFLKEWFYKEDERKESLNNSVNLQLGILTAIIAAIFYILTKYNYTDLPFSTFLFIFFQIATIIFWLISSYFLLMSYNNLYKGYKYLGFPYANFINDEYAKLKPYYEQYRNDLDKDLDSLVKDNIEKLLIRNIDNNFYLNDTKSAYLHKSKIHLLNCIILLLISTILFSYNFIVNPQIEITNVKIIKEMSNKPPPPPPPPQPREIKEHKVPKPPTPPRPPKTK